MTRRGLDVAVLNAGLINSDYMESPEGWLVHFGNLYAMSFTHLSLREQTIQVDTMSTTLIRLLLLQWVKQQRSDLKRTLHLVFVTSRDYIDPDIHDWPQWAANEDVLRHFSDRENWPSHQIKPNYAISKLLMTYAVEKTCKLAVAYNGR